MTKSIRTGMSKIKSIKTYKKVFKNLWVRLGSGLLVALLIFTLGMDVGNGRIAISTDGANGGLPSSLNFSSVNQVYQAIKQNYDGKLTTNQMLNGLKEGLAQATGDPYTEYFDASEAAAFNNELSNSFSGIGAELGQNSAGELEIIAPIDGSPAAKAGLKAQDIISEINGQTTSGLSPDTAADDIRGPAGTKIKLTIVRDSTQTLQFTITRRNIQLPSVTTKILAGNIGYMQISTFSNDTASLAQKAAKKFEADHVKGVILDLRDNPGGLVNAAVSVSSLWLPQNATIMQEKRGSTVVQTYEATGGDSLHGLPTVVLVNGGTASAAEITAGALHDNKAATVIGTKTYGKGVVQEVIPLSGGAEIKITVASWYRPDGQDINRKGITPDETVQLTNSDIQKGNDTQEAAAVTYIDQH